jgi:hypothetical protein
MKTEQTKISVNQELHTVTYTTYGSLEEAKRELGAQECLRMINEMSRTRAKSQVAYNVYSQK